MKANVLLVELQRITTDDRIEKHRLDEECSVSVTDDRRKKHRGYKEIAEVSSSGNERADQSISRGQGIQRTGSNFSSGGALVLVIAESL